MKIKKPHKIKNKLEYVLRHRRLWHTKVMIDRKKEQKKRGVDDEHIT